MADDYELIRCLRDIADRIEGLTLAVRDLLEEVRSRPRERVTWQPRGQSPVPPEERWH